MELNPGAEVERYDVETLLGEGGMAIVYRVRHRTLGSLHALKILTVTSPKLRERLIREGRVQATMQHPNVVAVTDVVDVRGTPGLIMQYVDGPTLESWLDQSLPALSEAERIFHGVLDAVEAAHAVGVVHRDLKPANVLLARTPSGLVPRVADFGIARAVDDDEHVRSTRSGAAMGTPAFMAPEQIRDARSVDHRADIFSLGCILYEMTTGKPAFKDGNVLDVFEAISQNRYRHPLDVKPGLPAGIVSAIEGALLADRDQRIPDCATFRAVMRGQQVWSAGRLAQASAALPDSASAQFATSEFQSAKPGATGPNATLILDDEPAPPTAPAERRKRTMTLDDPPSPTHVPPPAAKRATWLTVAGLVAATALGLAAVNFWPDQDVVAPHSGTAQAGNTGKSGDQPIGNAGTAAVRAENALPAGEPGQPATDAGNTTGEPPTLTSGTTQPATTQPAIVSETATPTGSSSGSKAGSSQPKEPPAAKPKKSTVSANATGIRLIGTAGSFGLGEVPPGTYQIQWTRDGKTGGAGDIQVREGEKIALNCDEGFATCERK